MERFEKPTYTLRTNTSTIDHGAISVFGFEDYINHFDPNNWDFMVLEPSFPIKGTDFIQVGAPSLQTNHKLEIEIAITNPNHLELYRYYTTDKKEVLKIMADYFEKQEIPDYSNWHDMSDELK